MAVEKNISAEILEYLRKHPDASDTLEGIAEWWLFSQRIGCEVKKVRAAVCGLLRDGWIVAQKSRDATVRYRLNPAKRDEICDKS